MDNQIPNPEMLELIVSPCFCVKDGTICQRNRAASILPLGDRIQPLLCTGQEEYAAFSGGSLYLTLSLGGSIFGAAVERKGGLDFFLLEYPGETGELRVLALAAKVLRQPLTGILSSSQELRDIAGAEETMASINRGAAQLLRILGNMSSAAYGSFHPEMVELTAAFREIFEKASVLLADAGLVVSYQGPETSLYCMADLQELERAILNLLSNAAKFSPQTGIISCTLARQGRMLRLCIQDSGSGIADEIRGSVFLRYLRHPAIEDNRFGLGLGLVLVRSCASHHGGTVLIDHPAQGGTRVTMTLAIRQDGGNALRSPILRVDYAGERDHDLVELSEVLPQENYKEL